MLNSKYFITKKEDVPTLNDQGSFMIDVSQFSIHQVYDMFNIKSDQTSGINSAFIDKSDDSGTYWPVDFSKPPKFGDPPS